MVCHGKQGGRRESSSFSGLSPQLQWQAALRWLLQHTATENQQRNVAVEKHLASLQADRQVVIVAIWWVIEITTGHNHIQQHRTSCLVLSFPGPRRLVRDPVCCCACDLHNFVTAVVLFSPLECGWRGDRNQRDASHPHRDKNDHLRVCRGTVTFFFFVYMQSVSFTSLM